MNAEAKGEGATDSLKGRPPSRGPLWLAGTVGLMFVVVALAYSWFTAFSRPMSPDEGYLMITVQSFLAGEPLYDSVFTQYGPFYYLYEWLLHAGLSVPLTHDTTRMLGIVHWLAAAVLLGCAAKVMTASWHAYPNAAPPQDGSTPSPPSEGGEGRGEEGRYVRRSPLSWLVGLFVFAQAMVHLSAMSGEPGHPQELVALLLALGMLVATGEGRQVKKLALLATVGAVLTFTKINAGIFLGVALLLAMRCAAEDRSVRSAWTWLLAVVCAALPLLLMRRHLGAEWCRNYIVLAAAAIGASWLVAQHFAGRGAWGYATVRNAALLFLAVCVAIIGVVLATGTSLRGILDGLLLTPLKLPGVALLPIPLSNAVLLNAAASLAIAIVVRMKAQDGLVRNAVTILKAILAIAGAFCLFGNAAAQLAFLLPWVWLVAVPRFGESAWNPRENFPRVFLCLAAAFQGLQAYPIAGTQVTMATLLLMVAYGVCLADVFEVVAAQARRREWFTALTPRRLQFARALAVFALLCVFTNVWCKLPAVRLHYASLPALGLPGSRHVRFDQETTAIYRELARYLERECDTFVTYPGFNSLYFWTGKPPPTHLNSTGWGQLSHRQQEQILGSLRQAQRPLLVVVAAAAESWKNGAPEPIRPLVQSVREDFREVQRISRFIVFAPRRVADTTRQD